MRRMIWILVIIFILTSTHSALAKGTPDLVTVVGPGLDGEINVTDRDLRTGASTNSRCDVACCLPACAAGCTQFSRMTKRLPCSVRMASMCSSRTTWRSNSGVKRRWSNVGPAIGPASREYSAIDHCGRMIGRVCLRQPHLQMKYRQRSRGNCSGTAGSACKNSGEDFLGFVVYVFPEGYAPHIHAA